jgi:hypothetical protein
MKKFELSRVAPLALSGVMSLWLSFAAADVIAAQGTKAVAALRGSQAGSQLGAQPVLAQWNRPAAIRSVRVS